MGLFGCSYFPVKEMFLAVVHRQICMPIISWLFTSFLSFPMESFLIIFPTSECVNVIGHAEGKVRVHLKVKKPIRFCIALLRNFKMGLAESYAEDVWTAEPNPKEFLSLLIRAKSRKVSDNFRRSFLKRIWAFWHSSKRAKNTVAQAHRNAQDHYDLGNDMFRLFLDRSLTYSCAIFEDLEKAKLTVREAPMKVIEEILYEAQMHKYDAILDGLGTMDLNKSAGCQVLEIGCGWGAFSIRAVERYKRLKWTGLTLSKEQLRAANVAVELKGLSSQVELKLMDYRDDQGLYDHIVAVEMIEAVGHEFLPCFFSTCTQRLKPGGRLSIQAILCRDELYENYRNSTDFIRKHIFPGGHLPSMAAIKKSLPDDLKIINILRMDEHYALTLDIWRKAWLDNRKRILSLKSSEQFYRKWDMYFSLCSALFENHIVHVAQILLEKC